jgi:hypothetical protein
LNGIVYTQVISGRWEETSVDAKVIGDRYEELFGAN